jgi:HTH-type transcriptional regulator / antitoxin HipB
LTENGTFVPTGGFPVADFTDQLAAAVRARRAVLRLTQQDLAELAGVSERFVRFVEQGKRSVQLDSLLVLLETLGLELQLATRSRAAARALDGRTPDGQMPGGQMPGGQKQGGRP